MKVVARIRRKRLDHWWYYRTNDAFPSREAWREGGHLLEGVDLPFHSINQRNRKTGGFMRRVAWMCDGEGELVQNELPDYAEQIYLDGPMNFAFQTGDQLFIFRYRIREGGVVEDNRLSLQTDGPPTYGELRNKASMKIAGMVRPPIEAYQISGDVTITNGVLRFKKIRELYAASIKRSEEISKG